MKSINLLLGSALLGAGFLLSISANAQSSSWDTNENSDNMSILSKWKLRNGKHVHHSSGYQEKANTENRLISYIHLRNDGVRFIPNDSTTLGWKGENNNPHVEGDIISGWSRYASPKNTVEEMKLSNFQHTYPAVYSNMYSDSINTIHGYDDATSEYYKWYLKELNLDANGNVVSEIHKSHNYTSWENSYTTLYTYDAQHQATEVLEQTWSNSIPENSRKTTYSYDVNGKMSQFTFMTWDVGASSWNNEFRGNYTFDAQGYIHQYTEEKWENSTWVKDFRETRTYTGAMDLLFENWDGAQWVNAYNGALTYTSTGNPLVLTFNSWESGSWAPSERTTYTYDASGNLTNYIMQEGNLWSWRYDERYTYTYNSDNKVTEAIKEKYDTIAGSFENMNRALYDYNSNGESSTFTEESWDGSAWNENVDQNIKYIFYYEEIETTGLQESLSGTDFNLFPNPAADNLTVQMGDSKSITKLAIIDLSGRVVYQTQEGLSNSEVTIPVNNLMNGMYFLHITSDGQKGTKPFVVKH